MEGKSNVGSTGVGVIPNLAPDVGGSLSVGSGAAQLGVLELVADQVHEFLMVLDASGRDHQSVVGEVGELELLDHLGRQVGDIAPSATRRIA